jgi:hypothetical protein
MLSSFLVLLAIHLLIESPRRMQSATDSAVRSAGLLFDDKSFLYG